MVQERHLYISLPFMLVTELTKYAFMCTVELLSNLKEENLSKLRHVLIGV